jgi:membrane protease YdiL (CAAX protease family)
MTALVASGDVPAVSRAPSGLAPLARPFAIVAVLGAVVLGRWAAWRSGILDPIVLGALFGASLVAVVAAAGWRPTRPASLRQVVRSSAIGLVGGLVLVATALVGPHPVWSTQLFGAFPLVPWAAATILVATAEEAVLRGALFDALDRPHGPALAVVVTSAVFALMHVPVYGLQAIPLDLGVGLVLGGLRLLSGGVAAPAIAHALADIAVLWM